MRRSTFIRNSTESNFLTVPKAVDVNNYSGTPTKYTKVVVPEAVPSLAPTPSLSSDNKGMLKNLLRNTFSSFPHSLKNPLRQSVDSSNTFSYPKKWKGNAVRASLEIPQNRMRQTISTFNTKSNRALSPSNSFRRRQSTRSRHPNTIMEKTTSRQYGNHVQNNPAFSEFVNDCKSQLEKAKSLSLSIRFGNINAPFSLNIHTQSKCELSP